MTREDVKTKFPEATEEQITFLINLHHAGVDSVKASLKPPVDEAELKRLQDAAAEYEKLQSEGLTDTEKFNKMVAEAEKMKADYAKKSNRLEAEKVLLAAGVKLEENESLIEGIISEDLEKTTTLASSLAKLLADQKEAVEKATKQKLMDETPTPGGGKSDKKDKEPELTEAEKIAEEMAERKASSKEATEERLKNFM